MQITEVLHIIHEPLPISNLQLQVILQLTLLQGDQVLALYLVLVEYLTICLHLYGVKKIQHLFHAPFIQILSDKRQLRYLGQAIILHKKGHIEFLDIRMHLLKIAQIDGIKSFLIQVERRKLLLTTMLMPFLLLLPQFSPLIHLIIHLLLLCIIMLSFAPLHTLLELSNII